MEKTYIIATQIFSWIITVSLVIFAYFSIKLHFYLIGGMFMVIIIASILVNVLLYKKWK